MKIQSKLKQTINKRQASDDVALFPRKIRLAIMLAFIAIVAAIVVTGAITLNMIFNPTIPASTEQKK